MTSPIIAIEAAGLAVGYPDESGAVAPVLQGVDLSVARGEFLTILGPSGCGKSTLLRAVADLLPPSSGKLSVLGGTAEQARRRRKVAFVFQDATLLPWRTVRQNVELPLKIGRGAIETPIETDAEEWLALVGLAGFADRYPNQLSGGQRQRVAIARALLCNPSILLLDEPFGALDEITRDRLNDELLAIWRRTGTTILFVTHSIMEAVYLGGRVMVLAAHPGRVQEILDLSAMKDADGRSAREAPEAIAAMVHLRGLLAAGASAS
ncbi:NitT/TauT family transport system ATP-binding protein [Kaistia dalseonensis]|uniref:NitT/TauT family transport system ATP-binding protein n=1 Tax=Kaistia dalseonensis TaxID=410840 RepID=A0ABU0HE53_9HYPH|nr:NitT/TauT family transport system ATP-binding protein [Kaistia dalseonensis]